MLYILVTWEIVMLSIKRIGINTKNTCIEEIF